MSTAVESITNIPATTANPTRSLTGANTLQLGSISSHPPGQSATPSHQRAGLIQPYPGQEVSQGGVTTAGSPTRAEGGGWMMNSNQEKNTGLWGCPTSVTRILLTLGIEMGALVFSFIFFVHRSWTTQDLMCVLKIIFHLSSISSVLSRNDSSVKPFVQ